MKDLLSRRLYWPPVDATKPPLIFLVEDDQTVLTVMTLRLKAMGYIVETAMDGLVAWEYLQANHQNIDAVVLDRVMPGIDGLELMHRIKGVSDMSLLPVVMHTASGKPEQIREGIEAGVFYYLTKPCPEEVLYAVVSAAVRESLSRTALTLELKRQRGAFLLMENSKLTLRTLEEAENAACWLAHGFDDPARVVCGLGAMLINAVEHGCAGIGYEGKGPLLRDGVWRETVAKNLELPTNRERRVSVELRRSRHKVEVTIEDEGPGFDWRKFENMAPDRAQASHGRGIARARAICFDGLEFNAKGNRVTVWVES